MSPLPFLPLFALIPMALLLASIVGLVWLWVRVLRSGKRRDLPTCGKCGYAVRGAAGLTCPECGHDLREVGILTPKQRGAVRPLAFILLWTLCLPVPAMIISAILLSLAPTRGWTGTTYDLTPRSGAYQRISLSMEYQYSMNQHGGSSTTLSPGSFSGATIQYKLVPGPSSLTGPTSIGPGSNSPQYPATTYNLNLPGSVNGNQMLDWIRLTVWSNGSIQRAMSITPRTAGYWYADANNQSVYQSGLPDAATVRKWFAGAGVNVANADVRAEVDELAKAVQDLAKGKRAFTLSRYTGSALSWFSGAAPAQWLIVLLPAAWLLIYAGGIALYFFIRHRRRQKAQPLNPWDAPIGVGSR